MTEASTLLSIEVEANWAFNRLALALTKVCIEVVQFIITFLVNAITCAVVPEKFLTMRAGLWHASALAGLLIEVRKSRI